METYFFNGFYDTIDRNVIFLRLCWFLHVRGEAHTQANPLLWQCWEAYSFKLCSLISLYGDERIRQRKQIAEMFAYPRPVWPSRPAPHGQ